MTILVRFNNPFGGRGPKFFRLLVGENDDILSCIEALDPQGKMRMLTNYPAVKKMKSIIEGKVKPKAMINTGSFYFGTQILSYHRNSQEVQSQLTIHIYTALGRTLEEHDERYRRLQKISKI